MKRMLVLYYDHSYKQIRFELFQQFGFMQKLNKNSRRLHTHKAKQDGKNARGKY